MKTTMTLSQILMHCGAHRLFYITCIYFFDSFVLLVKPADATSIVETLLYLMYDTLPLATWQVGYSLFYFKYRNQPGLEVNEINFN